MRNWRATARLGLLAGALFALPMAAEVTAILGRPTASSVDLSAATGMRGDAFVEYGIAAGEYSARTGTVATGPEAPAVLRIEPLEPGTLYFYRLRYRAEGGTEYAATAESTFHTQRSRGSSFVFTVQADSHLGTAKHCDPELYARALGNVAADGPDFHIDLGDTFRADHINVVNPDTVAQLYRDQRPFLALAGAPVFLVTGNHEVASAWLLDGTADNVAVWAVQSRLKYFLNPHPDGFYSGDEVSSPFVGRPGDYFAWEWGDALFVAIDPYWHTTRDPRASGDNWDWTLGIEQYRWLERTLSSSSATFKFVFAHHVQGDGSRGGIEPATLYEWGGLDRNGASSFAARRPGWGLPIHALMARYGVTVFFQGHDHLFARQELDGVVYQTCPMPADWTYTAYNADAYLTGVTLPNAGHLRVTVAPSGVRVDYVRAFLPRDESALQSNGEVACSYSVSARAGAPRRRAIRP